MNDDELDYYARHIVLPQIGGVGQNKLKKAKVALVGLGGIGAGALPALVGAGIGHLTLIDDDTVDLSNLQRQPLYRTEDVGKAKTDLAKAWAESRNPHIDIETKAGRLTEENAHALMSGHDLILDGTDNFATRLLVADTAVKLGIPLIAAQSAQLHAQVGIFKTRPCYRCVVGDAFDAEDCDNCAELGALGALVGMAGQFAALLAVRHLVGHGANDAGKLHWYDSVRGEWRSNAMPADPACQACGGR